MNSLENCPYPTTTPLRIQKNYLEPIICIFLLNSTLIIRENLITNKENLQKY